MSDRTVLIVEDDHDLAELLARLVTSYGATPVICHDGAAVDNAIQKYKIALVLLDIMLPGDDGRHIALKLHAQKVSFPIYFMTGLQQRDLAADYLKLADGVLQKPFGIKELREILDKIFNPNQEQSAEPAHMILELMAVFASEQENLRREQTRLSAILGALNTEGSQENHAIIEQFSAFGIGLEASLSRLATRLEGLQALLKQSG